MVDPFKESARFTAGIEIISFFNI